MPTIIVESNVPYADPLGQVARVVRLAPEDITPESVRDADALIVRTRTRCDAALLQGSRVKVVATATIGTDHIDIPWCLANGIVVANAPGCNAPAVAQYVFSSLMRVVNRPLQSYCIGIVGVGHVGSIVARWAEAMGMKVMLCDPPRQRAEGGDKWATLDDIARDADVITFHTPLTRDGQDKTYHLADDAFFRSLRRAPIMINAARGPVVDTDAWVESIDKGLVGPAVVDCWEGEPTISRALLDRAAIATPHIAGYSREGKLRATQMAADAVCEALGLPSVKIGDAPLPPLPKAISPRIAYAGYDPQVDTDALRAAPERFENLRNTYNLRPELPPARRL